MPRRRKRALSTFSLSFLDCMCCGFGAVVLFFMIINASAAQREDLLKKDLQDRAETLENELSNERERQRALEEELLAASQEAVEKEVRTARLRAQVSALSEATEELDADTLARIEDIRKLQSDLQSLDSDTKRLEAAVESDDETGRRIRSRVGDGDRQYLTGLKVGGRRVMILVDASASMLDETVVNIIRRRNMSRREKMESPKWKKVVETVDWLTTQFSPQSEFQIYVFSREARPLIEGTAGRWLPAEDLRDLDAAVSALRKVVPGEGTSLVGAFEAVGSMKPRPDNVFLLTDGLPTLGRVSARSSKKKGGTIDETGRVRLFGMAIKELPSRVPVNVLLYPLEGDPQAAVAYWELARRTGGAFLTPSKDWP